MKENNVNSRELIVTMLMSINGGDEYSHILIRNVLDKYDYLDNKEKAFIKNVTEGSIERRIGVSIQSLKFRLSSRFFRKSEKNSSSS